ncbi:hypothetical protein PUN4_850052 [Paraburkholderia unamae]|nr:hypothetical protein PUN4_850052 [Paraburkholderia unamae]
MEEAPGAADSSVHAKLMIRIFLGRNFRRRGIVHGLKFVALRRRFAVGVHCAARWAMACGGDAAR